MMGTRNLAVAAAIAGLGVAAVWSLRVACADYLVSRETLEDTEGALRWMPGCALYRYREAVLTADSDPARSLSSLERAIDLNPLDGASWIELGLRLEAQGRLADAERSLLRAAEADRQYLPRWTLANFYFRRKDTTRFWRWAKLSAGMVYRDATPLFRLCGELEEDGELIGRLGIAQPEVRANYLAYLLSRGRSDLIMPATRRVLEDGRETDTAVLLTVCDRLLHERRTDQAVEIWNRLAQLRRIPFGKLEGITNGNFAVPPISHGFDWRLAQIDGVSPAIEEGSGGLRLTFSGRQPESCDLLTQFVPVREGGIYALQFAYRTYGIPSGAGLKWRVAAAGTGGLAESESLSSADWTEGRVEFRTPPDCGLVRIALQYRRTEGTTRIAGYLGLKRVSVRLASAR